MHTVQMNIEAATHLEESYLLVAKQLALMKQRLEPPLREYDSLTTSTTYETTRSSPFSSYGTPEMCLEIFDSIISSLEYDAKDVRWRREWLMISDMSAEGFPFIAEHKLQTYSTAEIIEFLKSANLEEISDARLNNLLSELAVRSIGDPDLANHILLHLGTERLGAIFEKIETNLYIWLSSDADLSVLKERQSLHLLPLSVLLANSSRAKDGMATEIEDWLLPREISEDAKHNIRYLGMALGTARFGSVFLATTGIYMLNKTNRKNVLGALSNHPLKLPNQKHRGNHSRNQPFEKLLSPGKTAFSQLVENPDGYLELFANPRLAGLELDVDTYIQHQIDYWPIFSEGMSQLWQIAAESPESALRVKSALPTLGAFTYRNQRQLGDSENFFVSAAILLAPFIPDIRSMATEVTVPLLAPIVADPEAMVVLSGSIGVFALDHINRALEVEFDPNRSPEEKQRLISAHSDAVSDIYYHIFTAMGVAGEDVNESASILSSAFSFGAQYLLAPTVLRAGLGLQLPLSTAIFISSRVKEAVFDKADAINRASEGLTPQELFTRQIINRDYAGPNSIYPEPTWFELEVANRILSHSPASIESLETGRWFDGKKITPPNSSPNIGTDIISGDESLANIHELLDKEKNPIDQRSFSEWFAMAVNADPPTEFSSSYQHIQKEFGRELLVDALSVEVDSALKEARAAKAAADIALNKYYDNQYYRNRYYGRGYYPDYDNAGG